MRSIGQNLAAARLRIGISQEELARRAKMRQSLISDRERDRYPDIKLGNVLLLAAALNTPLELLVGGIDENYDQMIASLGDAHGNVAARAQDLRTIHDLESTRDHLLVICQRLLAREKEFCAASETLETDLRSVSDSTAPGSTSGGRSSRGRTHLEFSGPRRVDGDPNAGVTR